MLRKYIQYLFVAVLFLSYSCSSSEQSINDEENNDEVYVFDDVPADSTIEIQLSNTKPDTKEASYFLIQIGAFTTREKAEQFAGSSREIINDNISVSYSKNVNLFVVQLNQKFQTKNSAESKRDSLRSYDAFKDAWVVTVY